MVRSRRRGSLEWRERGKEKDSEDKEVGQHNVQKELKQKPMTKPYYQPSPQYTPSIDSDAFTPVLTDTLVQPPLPAGEECLTEEQNKEEQNREEEQNIEGKDVETDYDSNDMVTVLRAEYI